MKTIGIIGGLGPEATTDYYKEIIKRYSEIHPDANLYYPEMVIYSVNLGLVLEFMEKKQYQQAVDYLATAIARLKSAGAHFAAISANTPHLLFNQIQQQSQLPLISIVETAKSEAIRLGVKKAGLIGTKFTMQTSYYAEIFNQAGIEIVVPAAAEIELIHQKLIDEIEIGILKDDTRAIILGIVAKMINQQKIDALILGCTELPLMFTHDAYLEIPFLNTTRLHAAEIVAQCMA